MKYKTDWLDDPFGDELVEIENERIKFGVVLGIGL